MFGSLGGPELVIVVIIGVLLFGTGRLPELGKGLGEAIRNFKKAMHESEGGDEEK
jgi:sec-independent protein translocase protein TatA